MVASSDDILVVINMGGDPNLQHYQLGTRILRPTFEIRTHIRAPESKTDVETMGTGV